MSRLAWCPDHICSSVRVCTKVPGLGPRCNIGNRIGLFCTGDAFCRLDYPNRQPGPAHEVAMCNGPMLTEFTGTYGGGSSVLNLPVSFSLSLDPGPDTLLLHRRRSEGPVLRGADPG